MHRGDDDVPAHAPDRETRSDSAIAEECTPELTPAVYASWRTSELGRFTEAIERKLILDLVGDVSGKTVLEIGCGDGALAVELARRGARVTGIDTSHAMLAAARERAEKAGEQVEFIAANAEALPFDDGTFDVVIAVTILCFVKDAQPVFSGIGRALRPGGALVIGELRKRSSWAVERRIRAWLGSTLWKKGVFRTSGELVELARGAALRPDEIRGAVFYPRWTPLARLMAPYDDWFSKRTLTGAAFLAMRAIKPAA
jgi:2-polyprenyl-3-methyl-5-hydroxy-6-metoxy-1,4-benzoquinol methylase